MSVKDPVAEPRVGHPDDPAAHELEHSMRLGDTTGSRGRAAAVIIRASIGAALAIVLALAGFAAVLPVLAVLLGARLLPPRVAMATRVLLSLPLTLSWLLAATAILQPFGIGLDPLATWAPYLAIVIAARPFTRPTFPRHASAVRATVPILLAVLAAGFLGSGAVVGVGGSGPGVDQRLALAAGSEDGASHYAIYDTILHVSGFAYTDSARRHSVQWSYPPAFHLSAAALATSLAATRGTTEQLGGHIDAFWGATLLAFVVLVSLAAAVAGSVARVCGGRGSVQIVAMLTAAAAVFLWSPFTLLQMGFLPQALALAFLLAATLALLDSDELGFRATLAVLAATTAAIAWTWYFLMPVVGLYVLAWLAWQHREAWNRRWMVLGAAIASLIASAPPILQSTGAGSLEAVNAGGGVAAPPMPYIFGITLVGLGGLLLTGDRRGRGERRMMLVCLLVPVAFSAAFYSYQIQMMGAPAYFYFKSLFTVQLVGIPLAVGATLAALSRATTNQFRSMAAISLMALGGATALGIRADKGARENVGAWRYRDAASASIHRPTFARYLARRDDIEGRYIYIWSLTSEPTNDYFGTRWLAALNGSTTKEFFDFMVTSVWIQDDALLARFINDHPREVTVVTGDPNLPQRLRDAGLRDDSVDGDTYLLP